MGYHISTVMSISPNDKHSFFAYYIPSNRLEYFWVNDWLEQNFLHIAELLGPTGVIVSPIPKNEHRYVRELSEVVKHEEILHTGFPFLVFSRRPIHSQHDKEKVVVINLAACESAKTLGGVIDVLIAVCNQDNWNEIARLPDLNHNLMGEQIFDDDRWVRRAFARTPELRPNIFDPTIQFPQSILSELERHVPARQTSQPDDRVKILFLMADPTDQTRLRLGDEFREIQDKLMRSRLRERFQLVIPRLSVRPSDISQALLEDEPQIVHFSGHGAEDGSICFENRSGQTQLVSPKALSALFAQFANCITCVVLNACYSEEQAKAIASHIEYVVGMNQAIGDDAAIAFSTGFYQSLGAGRSIEASFQLGCVQIQLWDIPESLTPVLLKRRETTKAA